jgi:DNA-binding PadR family transcriptional regulator
MLKYALLALLARSEQHGYELKAAFEALLGGTWPLNIGQVYTVLSKLEQEGLVECEIVPQDKVPDRKVYSLTEEGRRELVAWMDEPTPSSVKLRDEIFLKLILQQTAQVGDAGALIWAQRKGHIDALAQLARWRDESDAEDITALLLDGAILRLEADLKWLELCEERLLKKAGNDDR